MSAPEPRSDDALVASGARVPLVGDDPVDAQVADVFARAMANYHIVTDLYRMLANSPPMLRAWTDFAWPLRHEPQVDRGLRELMICRVLARGGAEYERRGHERLAAHHGVPQEKLVDLEGWETSAHFSASERAALALTDAIDAGTDVSDALWSAVREHFDERDAIDLVLTAAFYTMVSRVIRTLRVPHASG